MLKIALFGAGRIGAIHAANVIANPRATLAYVYDVNVAAARAIAERCKARVAESIEAVLSDTAVDAVLISSPTNTHVELITASAFAGKAVFCEKPIDLDMKRIVACQRAIARTGIRVQLGFNRRYDRAHRAVRDAVRAGEVGPLELLLITSRDPGLPPAAYLETSGGLFRDMTIHDFDMARFILGDDPVTEVYAAGSVMVDPALRDLGDVDTAMVVMKAASGALVHINNSRRAAYGYDQRVEAFGGRGMIASENLRAAAVARSGAAATDAKPPLLNFFLERYAQAYIDELDDFIDSVLERKAPQADFEDGRLAAVLAEAAWTSLTSGRPVEVADG
ncbi:MAG TPA: inositol 2-dehydrogenase [Steroidobacteraceae bacterium]|jgi:myo-inositol 2-dehydrogenase/D-chiro-inositol 1-dehydrogenase|nr:inositol 2-dehydrogenase [Steroidobacteraceae bacterium]